MLKLKSIIKQYIDPKSVHFCIQIANFIEISYLNYESPNISFDITFIN
jgi:hypothetical protein